MWLRHRWQVAFVVSPTGSSAVDHLRQAGFPIVASSGRSTVFATSIPPPGAADRIAFGEPDLETKGIFLSGFYRPEVIGRSTDRIGGRWTSGEATIVAPFEPGAYRLSFLSTRPTDLEVAWGDNAHTEAAVRGRGQARLSVSASDLEADGTLSIHIRSSTFAPISARDTRTLGIFAIALEEDAARTEAAGTGHVLPFSGDE
jgi:hypothetical protein